MTARMNRDTTLGILRHFLTIAGGSLATNGTVSADEMQQAIGAILTLVGIIWSILEKRQRPGAPPSPGATALILSLLLPAAFIFAGCDTLKPGSGTGGPISSGDTNAPVMTPQRVQKITRLAVWNTTTAWTTRKPESVPKFEAALRGVDALVAEQNWDVNALAVSLTSSGSDTFTGSEGRLIISGTTLLIDTIAGETVDVRKSEYAQAVILGAQAGLRLGLGLPPTP